jgi:hypothetical protein
MSPEPHAVPTDSGRDAGAARRQRFALILTLALAVISAWFSYVGTRDTWVVAERRSGTIPVARSGLESDPAWDIELPEGPHRDEFQTSCLICHSARLPLGQPRFGREKWDEVIHKMVTAYGAPVSPKQEAEVADYLLAVRPPDP